MSDIVDRIRASLRFHAVDGDGAERAVCARQMQEAAGEIDRLRAEVAALRARTCETCEYSLIKSGMRVCEHMDIGLYCDDLGDRCGRWEARSHE